jgi:hypothetical protein
MRESALKRIEQLESKQQALIDQHIFIDGTNLTVLNSDPLIEYFPSNTGAEFHQDNTFVRTLMGAFGSGKSSTCCVEIVRRACQMPPWIDGKIRRSRWAIIRNTSGELKSTTLQTWLRWFESLGDVKKREKPYLTYDHTFNDGNGIIELQLLFLALDNPKDFRKLKSLEVTGAWVNESSEVPNGVIGYLKGRVNHRYPPLSLCPDYWCGIIEDTNPPDTDHPMYRLYEVERTPGYKLFKQPPGLLFDVVGDKKVYRPNPDCDNFSHLSIDYYTKLAEGQNEEFIKVYCLGEYGSVILGKRVYFEYNDDLHSVDDIDYVPNLPIYLGWDFGLTPACIVCQYTPRGQLRAIKELIAEDMGIDQFARIVVLPWLQATLKDYNIGCSWGDPAGNIRVETDESTCFDSLSEVGLGSEPASTNAIVKRLESVKYFLNRMSDGRPVLLVSRKGCPVLRKGFLGGYHFKRIAVSGDERYQEVPNKNRYSHPHDAFQYVAMGLRGDTQSEANKEKMTALKEAIYNRSFVL